MTTPADSRPRDPVLLAIHRDTPGGVRGLADICRATAARLLPAYGTVGASHWACAEAREWARVHGMARWRAEYVAMSIVREETRS